VTWAVREKGYSQRRACALVGLHPKTYRYASKRTGDEELRVRLRELASQRRRFGYRRLGLMLKRQGIKLNPEKLYRLYKEERPSVRKRVENCSPPTSGNMMILPAAGRCTGRSADNPCRATRQVVRSVSVSFIWPDGSAAGCARSPKADRIFLLPARADFGPGSRRNSSGKEFGQSHI
jgi:hypothetical protein